MMRAVLRNKKTPLQVDMRTKRVVFNRFQTLDEGSGGANTLAARYSFNCDCADGSLKTGVTYERLFTKAKVHYSFEKAPKTPREVFYFSRTKADGTFLEAAGFYTDDGDLYLAQQKTKTFSLLMNIGKNSKAVWVLDEEKQNMLAFVGEKGVSVYYIEGTETCFSKALLPVGCFAQGRLFSAAKGGKLVYLKPFAPRQFVENMDDCGEVQLPTWAGEVVALVAVGTYVYAFCNNGIFRVQVAASARDFLVETIPYPYGTIFGESVCVAAGENAKVFFLTAEGLYCLQNTSIRKVALPLGRMPASEQPACKGVCFEGKYYVRYIAFRYGETAAVVDVEKESVYETTPAMYETNVVVGAICVRDNLLQFMRTHETEECLIRSTFKVNTDFGIHKEKTLKCLHFEGKGDICLTVECDGRKVEKMFYMAQGHGQVEVGLTGNTFTLTIELADGTCVRRVYADIEYAK